MSISKLTALSLIISSLAACSVTEEKRTIDRATNDAWGEARYQTRIHAESSTLDAKRASQEVDRPYITGKPIPVSREVTLPLPLRQGINTTLLFEDGAVDLVTLAGRIQDATGIPVQVTPDALLPAEDFLPNLVENNTNRQSATKYPTTADPALATDITEFLPDSIAGARPHTTKGGKAAVLAPFSKDGTRPLDATLDSIALRLWVSWKYNEALGAIVFYRTETRTFEIRNLENTPSVELSAGLTGNTDGSSSGGIESRSRSSLKAEGKVEPMQALLTRVKQFMSRAGTVSAGEYGFLVVTDTKTALDRVDAFVKAENAMRSRRVEFLFEQITVEKSKLVQGGVNWDFVFSTSAGNGFDVSGLNSLIEQEGAAMSLGLSARSGRWSGSSVTLQALSKVGRVVSQRMEVFGSNNGQPATIGRPQSLFFIDKLEQTPSYSDNSKPTVSFGQKEIVYGRMITFIPNAYADGDINLAIKYDDTPEPVVEKREQPDGSYVQQPRKATDLFIRSATLRPGHPYVIAAQTEEKQASNERRTDPKAPIVLGGSDSTDSSQRVTVSVITAMVRER